MTISMAATARTAPHRRDTLGTALLVAVGRALAFLVLVVVVATAARGPLPGLSLAPASDGPVALVDRTDPGDQHPVRAGR
ncbi:hypothetical protein [Nocardioides sp. AX2bis]|uniref:hypothetical protein n=1 Tax=Nocardioides sp. AX2bis TaxID=2653157 RepID=UPI001358720D|nr:hypothetical protein [Nocardioides sp. AX2bis]